MGELVGLGLALAVAGAFAAWVYLRREPPVARRAVLAVLRAATLLLLVLLLWNPRLPPQMVGVRAPPPVVLLDASLSMSARDSSGAVAWEGAAARAREAAADGASVLLFGSRVRADGVGMRDSVRAPGDEGSLLAPALERAAALGGSEIQVLSDLRLDDPLGATRAIRELEVPVRFERLGGAVRNAGVGEASIAPPTEPGGTARASLLVHGEGGAPGDSVELTARLGERLLARRRVALPEAGRPSREVLEIPSPDAGGRHAVTLDVELPDDGFPADDERTALLDVDPERAGILLLSLRPDWEPRFLLPVLGQVSGLRARGFLALGDGRWLPMGRMEERSGPVDAASIRRRLQGADLLVVHGLGAGAPGWVADAAGAAGSALLFAADAAGAGRLGLETAPSAAGEWYASPELPPSPLAGHLAGTALDRLPPLTSALPLLERGARVPLEVRRGRSGPPEAALVLRELDDARSAVVLASGFWRWGARDGDAREAYRSLWAGVAGWLLAAGADAGSPAVAAPDEPVARGRPVTWSVRGLAGDSVRLRVLAGDSAVDDTVVVPRAAAPVRTRALSPGSYRWEARADALPDGTAGGDLHVSGHSRELLRPVTEAAELAGTGEEEAAGAGSPGAGPPLRTHPLPYIVVLVLLSAEWIGRRRQGLR